MSAFQDPVRGASPPLTICTSALCGALCAALRALHSVLVAAYPAPFRASFSAEMRAIFAELVADARARGPAALLVLGARELWQGPGALATAYGDWMLRAASRLRDRRGGRQRDKRIDSRSTMIGGLWMGAETTHANGGSTWAIVPRSRAIWAALPPLVLGLSVAVAALAGGGRSWADMPLWERNLTVAFLLLPTALVCLGGLLALIRRLPDWGYTWLGSALVGMAVLVMILADERAEIGAHIISPAADVALMLALVLAGGAVLLVAAWRGWAQAGLTSVGFAVAFGMLTFSNVRSAPFRRDDVALLAAPMGLVQALLVYAYVRGRGGALPRWLYLVTLWALNGLPMLLAHWVWQPWLAAHDKPSPLLPLLVLVTILAWAGPLLGLLGRPVRRALGRG